MMSLSVNQQIERLREEIERHNHLYYVVNQPELTDAEYDGLFRKLQALEQDYPDLITPDSPTQRVGSHPSTSFASIEHSVPMLSFANAFDPSELRDFDRRVRAILNTSDVIYVAEPKLDGLAVELAYHDGRLVSGSTRGDGRVGEDVTANLRTLGSIPLRLRDPGGSVPSVLEVRGEVFIERDAFAALNDQRRKDGLDAFANPRNLAAGTLRQLDARITATRPLSIYFYDVGRWDGLPIESQQDLLAILPTLGLRVNPLFKVCDGIEAVIDFYDEIQTSRPQLAYEADGIVVKVDSFASRNRLGTVSRSPRWAIAGKFPPSQGMTKLLDILVSVGRTGALTPVAVLDPVRIHGVEISSATLHNEDEIVRKDIRIGDTVMVERAGDVIPKIARSLPELRTGVEQIFVMPPSCPVCGSEVVRADEEVAHRCSNPVCPARIKQSILHFISKGGLDVDGMGPRLVDQLVDRDIIASLSDLLNLDRATLLGLDRMGPTSTDRLLAALDRAKHVTLARLLFALGIPGVGAHLSSVLATRFGSLAALEQADEEMLSSIHEIGPLSAHAIAAFFANDEMKRMIAELQDAGLVILDVAEQTGEGALQDMRFVFTGSLTNLTRTQAAAIVEAQGGVVTSSVGRNTDYVVVGENPGSKADKARELGIPILTESAFLKLSQSDD